MAQKLKILVSLPTRENDFQIEQARSAEQTARTLGIAAEISYADNDAVNQSTQILKALQRDPETRPDGIVFEPIGGDALPRVARVARTAGVGWAVLNRAPEDIAELRSGATAPIFTISGLDGFEGNNLLPCCRMAVLFFTSRALRKARRQINAPPAC